jgi:hypothetical protein
MLKIEARSAAIAMGVSRSAPQPAFARRAYGILFIAAIDSAREPASSSYPTY